MTSGHERLDPVYDSERGKGSTPPEQGVESNNVTGRPNVEHPRTAFHQRTETTPMEREPFNEREALEEGGSFDSMGPPGEHDEK
jgi:hypothetical protein